MRHTLPHARWLSGLSMALGAIFAATFVLGLAAARWKATGVLAGPDCCHATLAEGMEIRFSLLLTLLLQPLLYGGRPWHCRSCQRLWLLASAGLSVALALILLLQGSLLIVIELGMGAWLGIEGSGTPDYLGPTIAALRERGLAWIWHLYAGALPAVLALQLLLCVLALRMDASSLTSGAARERDHGYGPRLRGCLRWFFAGLSFWIAFSSFAFLIWKEQPWLDYRFAAAGEADNYSGYLGPIFTVFPATFFVLQPLLYLGGARPRGWLGRCWLWDRAYWASSWWA